MSVPGDVETDRQPPLTVPLRHFVLGLGFLLGGTLGGIGVAVGVVPGRATLVHVHLLLAGWVGLTIMGALTQFVPVWSDVELHSRRLSTAQLWLVVVGLLGFAGSLLSRSPWLVPFFAGCMLAGFWVFVYNIGRTVGSLPDSDSTERHFVAALGFFLLLTAFGYLLAVDFVWPVFAGTPLTRSGVVGAHVTLAVFGAVVTTVLGALYQLSTMFTQTELRGVDIYLQRSEEVAYPLGVLLLAVGRLFESGLLARVGGVLVAGSLLGVSVILARRLYETRVDWTPMLSRYAIATPALAAWSGPALVAWLRAPLDSRTLFGAPGTTHLLVFGFIGFVVFGSLYHVVPFIIWVHRYSDRLGFEAVPMVDDLYDDRIATADFALLLGGVLLLAGGDWVDAPVVASTGGVMTAAGVVLFAANLLLVLRRHSPASLFGLLFSPTASDSPTRADGGDTSDTAP
ncbi:MAG: hypothetical protein ABEH77_11215 [Halobacteriaceae archaeon]